MFIFRIRSLTNNVTSNTPVVFQPHSYYHMEEGWCDFVGGSMADAASQSRVADPEPLVLGPGHVPVRGDQQTDTTACRY